MEMYDHDHGNGVRMCSAVARSFCELTFLSREAILKLSKWLPGFTILSNLTLYSNAPTIILNMLGERWPEVLKHFRDSAKEKSQRLRRRAGVSAEDDMYSLFRDQEIATTMIHSAVLVKKSVQLTKQKTTVASAGKMSSRIAPFRENEAETHEVLEAAQHHHFVSGNFDAFSSRSIRGELPLAQYDDDEEVVVAASVSSAELPVQPHQREQPELVCVPNPVENVAQGNEETKLTGLNTNTNESSAMSPQSSPKAEKLLFVRQETVLFDDFTGAAISGKDECKPVDQDAESNTTDLRIHPAERADELKSFSAGRKEAASLIPPRPVLTQQQKSATIRRDLHKMVEKIRNTTLPTQQNTIIAELVLLKGTYIFHPQETFIVSWQFVVGIAIMYSIIIVPLRLGFSYDAVGGWLAVELAIDSFFLLDIFISFRTAFFNEEKILIYDSRVIMRKYARSWFVPDLISTIPFDDITT